MRRLPLLVFALLLGIARAARADDLDDARKLLRAGDRAAALAKIDKALAAKPTDQDARFLKGVALAEDGRTNEAIEVYRGSRRTPRNCPRRTTTWPCSTRRAATSNAPAQSLDMAIRTNPQYAVAQENLGDVYIQLAARAYERAAQLDSANRSRTAQAHAVPRSRAAQAAPGASPRPPTRSHKDTMLKALFLAALLVIAPAASAQTANPRVELKTTAGVIVLELYPDKAPKTVDNFLQYVRDGYYNGTIFHRVIGDFMIQGGGFEPGMKQKPTRAADRERGEERPEERHRHHRDGAHVRPATPRPRSSSSTSQNNDGLNYPQPRRPRLRGVRPRRAGPGRREPHSRRARPASRARTATSRWTTSSSSPPPSSATSNQRNPMIKLHTNHGVIGIELDAERAPRR